MDKSCKILWDNTITPKWLLSNGKKVFQKHFQVTLRFFRVVFLHWGMEVLNVAILPVWEGVRLAMGLDLKIQAEHFHSTTPCPSPSPPPPQTPSHCYQSDDKTTDLSLFSHCKSTGFTETIRVYAFESGLPYFLIKDEKSCSIFISPVTEVILFRASYTVC